MTFRTLMHFRPLLLLACLAWGLVCVPQRAFAQLNTLLSNNMQHKIIEGPAKGEWKIDAARISYDQKREVYEAEGEVRITSGDKSIEADWAELSTQTHLAELKGHVLLKYQKDWLKGEHVVWNLDEGTGWVDDGIVFFAQNNFYIGGKRIAKTGPSQYELKEGFVTTCDPADSDWKIRYKDLSVNLEGIAWAHDASFWIRSIPIFYTPVVALPVQRERESGFLLPWGGISDLNGVEGELPFYWAIRPDMDATFYGRFMEKRGWMSGLEYRIANEKWGDGILLFHYLHDEASKDDLRSQGYPFQTEDRFWLRSRYSFELPGQIEGKLDLDMVSDKNYLKEFDRGSTSFTSTDRAFREYSGRGILNDDTVSARESSLYLERRWESSLLSLDTRYWNQSDDTLDETTLQRLPALSYSVIPSQIGRYPFFYSLESSIVNYWRPEGDRGGRMDLFPRLYAPMHWGSYLDIEPSFGLRNTSYSVEWEQDSHGQLQERLLSDVRLEMSSRLNRVYPVSFRDYVAVQHSIRPEVVYEYVQQAAGAQGELPVFDRLDRDQTRHDLRYGFTSFLTSKQSRNDLEGKPSTAYWEFARLQVFQAFNFETPPPDLIFDPLPHEGFSDVGMRLDVMPRKYVTLSYNADYFPEEGGASEHDLFMTLDSAMGHRLRLDYRYRNEPIIVGVPVTNEIIPRLDLKVLQNLYFSTYHDYSIDQDDLFSYGYGVKYVRGCWGIGIAYEKDNEDQRVSVSIDLMGLGSLGGGNWQRTGDQTTALP